MPVSDVETVRDFLRRNGFIEAENALRDDLLEMNGCLLSRDGDHDELGLGSFDYEKFWFPMLPPPPPPVRIPGAGGFVNSEKSSGFSSEGEEFVSLGSSTSDPCSSGFTNPYGRRSSSAADSVASSDGMSQFGTAREYHDHDFDMQHDLWCDEKEEGHFLTPSFQVLEPEDKFITTPEPTPLCFDDPKDLIDGDREFLRADVSIGFSDKPCLCNVDEAEGRDFGSNKRGDWNDWPIESAEGLCLDYDSETKEMVQGSCKISACKGNDRGSHDWSTIAFNAVKTATGQDLGKGANEDCLSYGEEYTESNVPANKGGESDCEDEVLSVGNLEDAYEIFDLRIIHRRNRTGFEENKDFPIVLNTIIAGRYYVREYLGSAAFSKVIQAHDLHTGIDVCLKIIKNDKDFFDQSLDEIKLLKLVNKHDPADQYHILRLYDYFYHQEHLFIVCELLRANLYEFQKFNEESGGKPYFTINRLQIITRQCLEALDYLHQLGIIHCDLKPENILIKSYRRSQIKVIDLGSSCFKSDNLCLYVQSRSYRAPEVILGLPYDEKIDIWSLGCILAELCSGEVLFPNEAIVMILARVIGLLGPIDLEMLENGQETPKYFTEEYDLYYVNEETNQLEYVIPEPSSLEDHLQVSDLGFLDFLRSLLEINPNRRPTSREALEHPWLSYNYSLSF